MTLCKACFALFATALAGTGQINTLTGSVKDPYSRPVTDATVLLRPKPPKNETPDPKFIRRLEVDTQMATFRFTLLVPVMYELVAFEENVNTYLPGCDEATAPKGGMELHLKRGASLPFPKIGPVLDDKNHPLAGVRVILYPQCHDWLNPKGTVGMTDNQGYATGPQWTGLNDNAYTAQIQKPAASPVRAELANDGPPSRGPSIEDEPESESQASEPNPSKADQISKPVNITAGRRPGIPFLVGTDTITPKLRVDFATGTVTVDYGLSVRDKAVLHLRRFYSPAALFLPAVVAAVNQERNLPEEWRQGGGGLARRYVSAYAYSFGVRNTMAFVLDSAFSLDPRYFPSTHNGWRRLGDAILQTVVTRTDMGRATFNLWRIGSAYGTGLLSREWYPDSSRAYGDAVIRASVALGLDTVANVVREFAPDFLYRLRRPGKQPQHGKQP